MATATFVFTFSFIELTLEIIEMPLAILYLQRFFLNTHSPYKSMAGPYVKVCARSGPFQDIIYVVSP